MDGDGAGNAVVVWASSYNLGGSIGTDNDIFYATSSDNGQTWSAPTALNSTAASDGGTSDFDAVVATDKDGVWLASWRSQWGPTGGDNEIICARSTNNGASWGTATVVNSSASTDSGATDTEQRISASGPDHFGIVWISNYTADGDSDQDILVSVTNDGGLSWSKVTYLSETAYIDGTTGDDQCSVRGNGSGDYIATWRTTYNLDGLIGTDTDILRVNFSPDFTAPDAVSITPSTTGPTALDSVSFTVEFDQDVSGFDSAADVVVTDLGNSHSGVSFSGGPAIYTVSVTGIAGDGTVTLAAATGAGTTNNLGVGVGSSVTSAAVTIDNTSPTPVLSATAGDPVGGAFTVTVDTGESTADFDAGDLSPTNGSVGDFSGSGQNYSFTLTPTSSPVSVSIGAGTYTDEAGNANLVSNVVSRNFDGTLPSAVTITPSMTGPTNVDSVDFEVSFDEAVTGFNDAADVVLTHTGTSNSGVSISGGPETYTVSVSGIGGDGSFTLSASTTSDVEDVVGNSLSSSVTSTAVVIDNTEPAFVNLMVTPSSAAEGESVAIVFDSVGLDGNVPQVTVNGNLATGSKAAHAFTYVVQGTDALGPAEIVITGTDLAGNLGVLLDDSALTILEPEIPMPVAAWPVLLAVMAAGAMVARRRR